VVVGTGRIGERKALRLTKGGATPLLVGPRATRRIRELARSGKVRLHEAEYRPELLEGATLVFAATDDKALNARIEVDARSAGALVNVVDNPACSDFLNVSDVTTGNVRIAVSTGGRSPAFARAFRKRLQAILPVDLDAQLRHFERWRQEIDTHFDAAEDRQRAWKELERQDLFATLERNGSDAADRLVADCVQAVMADHK
jgi:siroheme synthase-like protein